MRSLCCLCVSVSPYNLFVFYGVRVVGMGSIVVLFVNEFVERLHLYRRA
jgi:hypothetical protein